MDDDLNTPRALAALFDLARDINRGREESKNLRPAQKALTDLSGVLGLTLEQPASAASLEVDPFVKLLVQTRADLRSSGQFEIADKIREELSALGVALEDTPQGTEWRRTVS
jgi:cysteinyl-tRNA synthetase